MAPIKFSAKYIKFLIYIVVVALINVAGITLFFRLDLTQNQIYSLSEASKKVVSTLNEPLSIKVFFTRDLPAPHNTTEQYLRDLMGEYAAYSNKYFHYRFYDVSPEEGDLGGGSNENRKLANDYGIFPVQIQAIEQDEVKFRKAYMGLVMIHGDLMERIATITGADGLEYQLTTAIRKLNNKVSAFLNLKDKISVDLYLSKSLETIAPYMGLANMTQLAPQFTETMNKLNRKYYKKLTFAHLDPSADPKLAEQARADGIMSLNWPAIAKANIGAGSGEIGLVLKNGKKSRAVQLLQVLRLPIIGTQYQMVEPGELETIIEENLESLIDINENIGYLADFGALSLNAMPNNMMMGRQNPDATNNFRQLLEQNYSIQQIKLKDEPLPESIQCLMIARPTEPLSDYELFQIDQFLMKGKNIALFIDSFKEEFQQQQNMFMGNQGPQYIPLDTGLNKLLSHYGIHVQPAYVLDESCYKQRNPRQMGGGETPIYFAPMIKGKNINNKLDYMENLKGLVALKISPLTLNSNTVSDNKIQARQLFSSSEKSWLMKDRINLNPMFMRPPQADADMAQYALAYMLEGSFPSYFAGKPMPEKPAAEPVDDKSENAEDQADKENDVDLSAIKGSEQRLDTGAPGKIFVIGSADMIRDNLIDESGRSPNAMMALNVIDYLNGHGDIAQMRSKQQQFNPLHETSGAIKSLIKTINIAGLPLLTIVFGLLVWMRRRGRMKQIEMLFAQK